LGLSPIFIFFNQPRFNHLVRRSSTSYRFPSTLWNPELGLYVLVILLVLFSLSASTSGEYKQKSSLSEKEFTNPTIAYRPMALWTWMNGYVDTLNLVYELEEMKDKGMRGALVWDLGALINQDDIIPAGPAFLGPESREYISLALKTANSLGLDMGISSASSWNSGGEWITEENACMELLNTTKILKGPTTLRLPMTEEPQSERGPAENCTHITTLAYPISQVGNYDHEEAIILSSSMKEGEYMEWQVPDGEWEVMSFFSCNTIQPLVVPSPNSSGLIIDHLSKEATEQHFDELFSRLDKANHKENPMKFIFLDSYEVWQAMDWTSSVLKEFQARYEYDPIPYLPLLQGHKHKNPSIQKRFEGDYRRLVSDLIIENHYAQSVKLAENNGMQVITEAGHGGHPRVEPLKALGNSHIPMGEFWNRQRHWVTKEAASAANIYGKNVVASESLTGWNHWQHGPTDFKQLIDIAFCEGMNQVVFHTFSHNPEIAGKPGFVYHAGEHINVNTTWWEMTRPFMDYIARCSYMLRQGNYVADVLLYYGDEAPNLVPPRRMDPNYTPEMPGIFPAYFYDDSKCPHCGLPKPINPGILEGYQYDYVNEDIITSSLEAKHGELVLPQGASYKILVIPDREEISLEVLKSLEKLIYNGAVVVGRKPQKTTTLKGFPEADEEVKAIADRIWGECDGQKVFSNTYGKGTVYWGQSVKEILEERSIPQDLKVEGIENHDLQIDFVHRRSDTEEIYFVSNSSEEKKEITCTFRVGRSLIPELWDAETGLVQNNVTYTKTKNGIQLNLNLSPLASRFVVFKKKDRSSTESGFLPNLQFGFPEDKDNSGKQVSIDLSGNWKLSFDPQMGGPESLPMEKLVSWTKLEESGANYYSGTATYTRDFTIDENLFTNDTEAFVFFEEIQEVAQVFVNDQDCGIIWTHPYYARITPHLKEGGNTLTMKVINNWNNRIVGDMREADAKPFTQTNAKPRFNKDTPLLESGLMGKSEIILYKN
jgi:hypothetical protein